MRHGENHKMVARSLTVDMWTIWMPIMIRGRKQRTQRKTALITLLTSVHTTMRSWKSNCLGIEVQNGKNKCKAKGREV